MDRIGQTAVWLRDLLGQQPWLDAWQPTIAATPDWALLAAAPTTGLLLVLLVRLTGRKSRTPDVNTDAKTISPATEEARLTVPTPPRVDPVSSAKSRPAPTPTPTPHHADPAASLAPAPTAEDDEDNRSVRVFVSSTFLDMQTERHELVTKTFPALRAKYRARGVEVFEVDLRWGITQEQMDRGETLPILLAEIDRCRPYFLGLLGDRYGSVPPESVMTDQIRADYPSIAQAKDASITAMEIMHGVLAHPDAATRALFFERDPDWDWASTLDDADRAAIAAENEDKRTRLADLKAQIRAKAHVEPYAKPEEIQQKVFAALDALLSERFPEAPTGGSFEASARLHRAYARERRGAHVGAGTYLRALNEWMETDGVPPMLITGASGCGKSTLVASWLDAWRNAHPESRALVFEHYLGASPDSADPMLLMRRLWEHLNRATGEIVEIPDAAELMDLSARLAERLAEARAAAVRCGGQVLIALDGLDKLSNGATLSWLPLVPGVHVLTSCIGGDPKDAAVARGFSVLDIQPLTDAERHEFVATTLRRWGRGLEPQQLSLVLNPEMSVLAGSPLYLKTMLDELRLSADRRRLDMRLEHYRAARDMPDLFDRVLERLEADVEPGLVGKALPLISASIAGLEEAELLAVSGATPLAWASLRNGLGDRMRDQAGRINFAYEYLNEAVARRYLRTEAARREVHLTLADHFSSPSVGLREAEELAHQLWAAKAWDRLTALLTDITTFSLLRRRGDAWLLWYWAPLMEQGINPGDLLCAAFKDFLGGQFDDAHKALGFDLLFFLFSCRSYGEGALDLGRWLVEACVRDRDDAGAVKSLNLVANLHHERGAFSDALILFERALIVGQTLGEEHEDMRGTLGNLARTLSAIGQPKRAQEVLERLLEADVRVSGRASFNTFVTTLSLCETLTALGDYGRAYTLLAQVLELAALELGQRHRLTLSIQNALGFCLSEMGEYHQADVVLERVLDARLEAFGSDHADTLASMTDLAENRKRLDDIRGALMLQERVLTLAKRRLGPDDRTVVSAMSNLAHTLYGLGELDRAQHMQEEVLRLSAGQLAPDHPDFLVAKGNLALTLYEKGNYEGAQALEQDVVEATTRSLGAEHPLTLWAMNNLGGTLKARGDINGARKFFEVVYRARRQLFGDEHPQTKRAADNLRRVSG